MRRDGIARVCGGLAIMLLVLVSAVWAAPARAAAHRPTTSGYTLSLALANGTTFSYGGTTAPRFTAVLTRPAPPTGNYFWTVNVSVGGVSQTFSNSGSPTVSQDQLTYTFTIDTSGTAIPAGNWTATATFSDPGTGATAQSNATSFTVTKATPSLSCMINTSTLIISPGQTLVIGMTFEGGNPNAPVDWQDGTYTITFVGPSNVTTSGLAPDGNDAVTVQAPSQIGRYDNVECAFSGTANFTSASGNAAGQPLIVSEKNALGAVQVFSNPTTLASYQPADVYVVFHAGPGLPTPTGTFGFRIGSNYTREITLGPDGDYLVHFTSMPNLAGATQMTIDYSGDPYYDTAVMSFPLTNPPIPSSDGGGSGSGGSGSGGSGSGGSGHPQATATGTRTPTSAATRTGTAGTGGAGGGTSSTSDPRKLLLSTSPQSGTSGLLWLLVIVVGLLVVGGGAGVWFYLAHRAKSLSGTATALPQPTFPRNDPWQADTHRFTDSDW